jgi:pimeloyl-ACP methyl ester carboxylesterase
LKIEEVASPCSWQVNDAAQPGRKVRINGWDFSGGLGMDSGVEELPNRPLALLHHANGMCGAMWAEVALLLRKHYRVFAMDARGHGDSQALRLPEDSDWRFYAADVAEVAKLLIAQFGCEQIDHGIGSSYGGILTAAAEADHPGLFTRLTLLDPPIHPDNDILKAMGLPEQEESSHRDGLVAQTLKRRDIWPDRATAYDAWRHKPLFAAWSETAFQLYLDAGMSDLDSGEVQLKCNPKVEAHIFQTTGKLGLFDYAPKVTVPVTLVHASTGHFAEEFFSKVATVFPNAQFRQLEGGHMLPFEVPDAVADLLLDGS